MLIEESTGYGNTLWARSVNPTVYRFFNYTTELSNQLFKLIKNWRKLPQIMLYQCQWGSSDNWNVKKKTSKQENNIIWVTWCRTPKQILVEMLSLIINAAFFSKQLSSPEGGMRLNLTALIHPGILATKNPMPLPVNNQGWVHLKTSQCWRSSFILCGWLAKLRALQSVRETDLQQLW